MTWAEYWLIAQIFMIFDAGIVILALYFGWWKKRGRLEVRVKTPIGEQKHYKKPEKDGKSITMQKARGKRPGWKFTFTRESLYFIPKWFGRKRLGLDILFHAEKAIDYDFKLKLASQPKWTKTESKEFIEAEILKQRGMGLKLQLPLLFWLVLIIGLVNVVFSLLLYMKIGGIGL